MYIQRAISEIIFEFRPLVPEATFYKQTNLQTLPPYNISLDKAPADAGDLNNGEHL